jgi:hypothetical protein
MAEHRARGSTHSPARSRTAAADAVAALQRLLQVASLQQELYSRGVVTGGPVPAADLTVFGTLAQQELAHVSALSTLITERGGIPAPAPTFDLTAGGNLPGFTVAADQYATFGMLAQAFEDLAVRAYKGQLPELVGDVPAHVALLALHSLEGRHASEVRRLRGVKGWITGDGRDDLPAFLQPVYDGESNTVAGAVDAGALAAEVGGAPAASEALDEPLAAGQVSAILSLFVAS